MLVTASLAAAVHAPGMAAYAASKAGVEAFADSLRSEVKRLGVDVGVAYFGFIDTDMVRGDGHASGARARCATTRSARSARRTRCRRWAAPWSPGMERRSRWVTGARAGSGRC